MVVFTQSHKPNTSVQCIEEPIARQLPTVFILHIKKMGNQDFSMFGGKSVLSCCCCSSGFTVYNFQSGSAGESDIAAGILAEIFFFLRFEEGGHNCTRASVSARRLAGVAPVRKVLVW